ncbi:glycosyl transferase [Sporomusaceae bacterium FL31]|nr:glycosyl transferase [Sporomusaceae bacterium FL31]GCE33843.1 glycosyl transferase [Sporomusaceae bacterium]
MLTSIVMLTYNKLAHTQTCIDSIREYTPADSYELIVVDNHSTDGTIEWLQQQADIRAIFNSTNLGFPKGCNQGIEIANGDSVLLLNNDTIVTENWLSNLTTCLFSSSDIGAVGAVTNNCSYSQSVPVNYQCTEDMHKFAAQFNRSDPAKWEERLKLVGFCMLIKKSVIDEIGLLDEGFTPGNYEDDDYSLRIRLAGYKLMLCTDTFIHHFGSISFKEDNNFYSQLLRDNAKKFETKWGFNPIYCTFMRNEIVTMLDAIPGRTMRVLDIGCACGGTLLKIKHAFKDVELYGIELNEKSAVSASLFAQVSIGDVEQFELDYPELFFDYIIMADVLEHMSDPWKVLKKIRKHLRADGKLIASIPNVMHFSVIRDMINGCWSYQDEGILDRTHLRFFTSHEISKILEETGFQDIILNFTTIPANESDAKFINKLAEITNPNFISQYLSYQYLVKASKSSLPDD